MKQAYKRQVALLLNVLPEVARERCFALHGGTAINLFVHNMPRLSVDIDLTYLLIEDRASSFDNIAKALIAIEERINRVIPHGNTQLQKELLKLQISHNSAQIKIEVNQINRGCISNPVGLVLCDRAQDAFDAFCEINVVPLSQLFGGKIIAALDRQHPRDLFDIKYLLNEGGINSEIKEGFIFSLLSSNRPIYELLKPHLKDGRQAFANQFEGMSNEPFSYEEFEQVREALLREIQKVLSKKDKEFLIGFKGLEPNWDFYNFEHFPAIRWKLENIQKFKDKDPKGYQEALQRLTHFLT